MDDRVLKPGDVVEVRAPAEILTTLDSDASVENMPFMPEMTRYSGKRFTVSRRVEKICDTVSGGPPQSRRMRDTVLLEDLRCDGSGHDGCQAGCRLYWKESWLRRVESDSDVENGHSDAASRLEELTRGGARAVRDHEGTPSESYRCQATEAFRATQPLSNYDLRQYFREFTSKNVTLPHLLRVAARALSGMIRRQLRLLSYRPLGQSALGQLIPSQLGRRVHRPFSQETVAVPAHEVLDLRPGDTAQVRSPKEIARTVDQGGKTRGLAFDWEMIPHCGGRYRVQDRVERIIDEQTGKMIDISSDCLILEGVVCSGERSRGRWFCPRAIYPYWREAWLRRVENGEPPSSGESRVDQSTGDAPP
jgi:hypothetical protein